MKNKRKPPSVSYGMELISGISFESSSDQLEKARFENELLRLDAIRERTEREDEKIDLITKLTKISPKETEPIFNRFMRGDGIFTIDGWLKALLEWSSQVLANSTMLRQRKIAFLPKAREAKSERTRSRDEEVFKEAKSLLEQRKIPMSLNALAEEVATRLNKGREVGDEVTIKQVAPRLDRVRDRLPAEKILRPQNRSRD